MQHIFPCFGFPLSLQSDSGPVSQALGTLGGNMFSYPPQSSGKVERAHSLLMEQLIKLFLELHRSWTSLLPLALTRLSAASWAPSFLSPFELMFLRPYLLSNFPVQDLPLLHNYFPAFSLPRQLLRGHMDHIIYPMCL